MVKSFTRPERQSPEEFCRVGVDHRAKQLLPKRIVDGTPVVRIDQV
jgi:hypothetical protein